MALTPWLSVREPMQAIAFYKAAFDAVEVYRFDGPDGTVVARLAAEDGEFWVSDESPEHGNFSPPALGGSTVRMILTVADPDASFARAVAAGATVINPITEGHGWRVGRVIDPFEHHWEIGRELAG